MTEVLLSPYVLMIGFAMSPVTYLQQSSLGIKCLLFRPKPKITFIDYNLIGLSLIQLWE